MAGDRVEEKQWQVRGDVQGVGFRWSTRNEASRLGLDGWVRNEADGSVRVRARGESGAMRTLEGWLHSGPPSARVSEVVEETRQGIPSDEASSGGFVIRH